jgi:putative oxidoreductase
MKFISLYRKYSSFTHKLDGIVLLLIRLVLAYGFAGPALTKAKDVHGVIDWFTELGIPFPTLNAWLSMSTELAGIVLVALGLATRIIALPLIIVMLVAIRTVHWQNGFEAGSNGFEIPLYYILMLLLLMVNGGGKFSLDYWISRKKQMPLQSPAA